MRLRSYDGQRFVPFWDQLARNGTTVGVLDVPLAPVTGLSEGFDCGVSAKLHEQLITGGVSNPRLGTGLL